MPLTPLSSIPTPPRSFNRKSSVIYLTLLVLIICDHCISAIYQGVRSLLKALALFAHNWSEQK